ncbi:class A beta-lactamase-related serine hydrolase [Glycomyces sp. A-F 0318]|uniref:serine hydrolase n=1 Tax=Glycomyces amatae TaxID=2881355 RepID=UPI001E2A1BD3|nr:serine hydrolase [Glycomyces amatae]MCD0446885.1 class A beta-lactamase-related serine hydrolase [Glycomyces amatae]
MQRRDAIKLGAGITAAGAVLGTATTAHAEQASAQVVSTATKIKRVFDTETAKAGGTWQGTVTLLDGAAAPVVAVDHNATSVQTAASTNKLGIALGVLDKIDRGELALDDRVTLTEDIILTGSGFYFHQTAYGDEITVANVLVAMLLTSDNTSVRLCGLVCPPAEINEVLEAKGFTDTRVVPNPANPSRMWLGDTTTAETNDLLRRLAKGELLSTGGTRFLLNVLKGLSGYHDGFRRNMSSVERSRIAMKYGADDANRNEAGVVYNAAGAPALVYAFMSQFDDHWGNYGATHPAVQAHAAMGRKMLDIVDAAGLAASDAVGLDVEQESLDAGLTR